MVVETNDEIIVCFNSEVNPSIIAHESLYVCSYLFQEIGVEFDEDNDETLAYLLGWVVEQIHKIVKINGN